MNWKLLNRVWHANLGMAASVTLGIIALSCPFIAHKGGDIALGKALMHIHYGDFLPASTRWIWIDSQGFLLAFLVVSGLLMHRKAVKKAANVAADDPAVPGSSVTLLDFGTAGAALASEGEKRGLRLFRCSAANVEKLDLSQERWLIVLPGPGAAEVVARLCAKQKPGSIRRLQFAIGGETEAAEIRSSLRGVGAEEITLASGDFDSAVLGHLTAQSGLLAATKRLPAKSPPSAAGSSAGFTLLELLLSLMVIGFLIAGAAGALERMATEDRVGTTARSFKAMLEEARDLARREGTWVRVALLPEDREQILLRRGNPDAQRMGAAMFILRRPALAVASIAYGAATSDIEPEGLQEPAPAAVGVVPESLRAGWELAPGHREWHLWDPQVRLKSPVIAAGGAQSPWQLRPSAENPDFTDTLASTPVRDVPVLEVAPFTAEDEVPLRDGGKVRATAIYGSLAVKRWLSGGKQPLAANLPAIDFAPDGAVSGSTGSHETLSFRFEYQDQRPHSVRRIDLKTATGEVTLL